MSDDTTAVAIGERERICSALETRGYAVLSAAETSSLIGWSNKVWQDFAAAWDRLGTDRHMADGGRYRSRRHAAFAIEGGTIARKPHQAHYQSRDYNPLNGDVQRWFAPVEDNIGSGPIVRRIYEGITPLLDRLGGRTSTGRWHSEIHQFRIETSGTEIGRPTPEGLHRDGVDWVLVMLISRTNVSEGVTEIGDAQGQRLGSFILAEPGDAVLLDDRVIRHGVTPILPTLEGQAAHRDALVVTWTAEER